jgi:2-amino-4-hydroxy-6-hydroxymethyldihydropteridine diphosphokinase
MSEVLFGLGSNLGRPRRQLAAAVEMLRSAVEGVRVSSVYRTTPVGFAEQPDFLNIVLAGSSSEPPERLLAEALRIEGELGRVRTFPNAPRTIDIDLLALSDIVIEKQGLVLPHPRLHQRPFVLVPLAEVAPEWRHPVLGLTAEEMLAALSEKGGVERIGELAAPS